jgi:hypothetical protein
VDMHTATKWCLPTRHVTIKSRGGLLFVCKEFYHLIAKVEDHFYDTVLMRQNFALASKDAIINIKASLLVDETLMHEFNEMLSPVIHETGTVSKVL